MRRLTGEPRATDFVAASEYEASTPATFGLPEVPVLYAHCQGQYHNMVAQIWISSDGVYVWCTDGGFVAAAETVKLVEQKLFAADCVIELDSETSQIVTHALGKVSAFNAAAGAYEDNVEIAVPLDYESGQADDLGEAQLEHSIGMGLSLRSGPAVAAKRRRPS